MPLAARRMKEGVFSEVAASVRVSVGWVTGGAAGSLLYDGVGTVCWRTNNRFTVNLSSLTTTIY